MSNLQCQLNSIIVDTSQNEPFDTFITAKRMKEYFEQNAPPSLLPTHGVPGSEGPLYLRIC